MKILYQNILGFLKDYLANRLSYELNYPFVKPWRVNFDITHECPLRCRMCNIWRQKKNSRELSLSELKTIVDEIKDWGIDHVSFAGGETLLRKKDVIELIRHASSKNMRTDLITNGCLLDEKTCEELIEAGLSKISLSVDGASRETHDRIRGRGTFKKVMRSAKTLERLKRTLKSGIELEFTTVVLSYNFRELVDIFYLMKSLNFDFITYQVVFPDNSFTLGPDYFEEFYESEIWINGEEIQELERIIQELIEIKKRTGQIRNTRAYLKLIPKYFLLKGEFKPGRCIVGYSYLNIDPYGYINVCGLGPNINVRGNSIEKLWKSREFKNTRVAIKRCRKPCLMLCYDKLDFKSLLEAWLELRGWLR